MIILISIKIMPPAKLFTPEHPRNAGSDRGTAVYLPAMVPFRYQKGCIIISQSTCQILALLNCTIPETGTPGTGAWFEIIVPQGTFRRT